MTSASTIAVSERVERFGRVFVRVGPDAPGREEAARSLAFASRSGDDIWYELPSLASGAGGGEAGPFGHLPVGFRYAEGTDDDGPGVDPTPEQRATTLVRQHVQSMSELMLPGGVGERPRRVDRLTLVAYDHAQRLLWDRPDDEPPMDLVVHIADACTRLVEDLCRRPRELLRRDHELQPLGRVQEVDDACLRWLVRRPGRTVPEKAGAGQRILGVIRRSTLDTLENRVLRDFLERGRRVAREYCRQHEPWRARGSQRYELVRRFGAIAGRLLQTSEIGTLPAITGVVVPNYVLQFDDRYGQLWPWYERLRRQQQDAEDAMRWQHRAWAERVGLRLLRILDEDMRLLRLSGELQICPTPTAGCYLGDRSCLASWLVQGATGTRVVDAIPGVALHRAGGAMAGLANLVPDLVLRMHHPFDGGDERAMLLWGCLTGDAAVVREATTALDGGRGATPTGVALQGLVAVADPTGMLRSPNRPQTDCSVLVTGELDERFTSEMSQVATAWLKGVKP